MIGTVVQLPFHDVSLEGFFSAHGDGECAGLLNDDGFEGVALAVVWGDGFEPVDDVTGQLAAGGFVQAAFFFEGGAEAFIDHGQDGAVYYGLAEDFLQVEHERWFSGSVHMDEAGEGVEAGEEYSGPALGVEDAVSVVEHGVEGIGGALMFAFSWADFLGDEFPDGVPIDGAGAAFDVEQ